MVQTAYKLASATSGPSTLMPAEQTGRDFPTSPSALGRRVTPLPPPIRWGMQRAPSLADPAWSPGDLPGSDHRDQPKAPKNRKRRQTIYPRLAFEAEDAVY